jgi:hypothetical protein
VIREQPRLPLHNFLKLLTVTITPSLDQQRKELWDVEGIIKSRSNEKLKFDLRPLKNNVKGGSFKTKADKMVFDIKNQWIIVDVDEMHTYLKEYKLKKVPLENLISKLDWNIIIPQNQ